MNYKTLIFVFFIFLPFHCFSKTVEPTVLYRDALCVSSAPLNFDFSKYCTHFSSRKTLIDVPACLTIDHAYGEPSSKAYLCEKLTCKSGFVLVNPEGTNDGFYCDDSFYKK